MLKGVKELDNTFTIKKVNIIDYINEKKQGILIRNNELNNNYNYKNVDDLIINIMRFLTWNEKYDLLQKFIKENNNLPKCRDEYNGLKLGSWCSDQRKNKNNNKLSSDKIKKLEEIKEWDWGTAQSEILKDRTWDDWYNDVLNFIKENDDLPKCIDEYNGFNIGNWCSTQRNNKKNNKLSEDKIKKLEEIKEWNWGTAKLEILKDRTWNDWYNDVLNFIKENDDLPKCIDEYNGFNIGNWCSHQRNNKKNNKLSEDKIKKLEEIKKWYWINT